MKKIMFLWGLCLSLILNGCLIAHMHESRIIDVVIPCHEKDAKTLDLVIDGIKNNIRDVRNIVVVSKRKFTDKALWFDEALYPFSRRTMLKEIFRGDLAKVQQYEVARCNRTGWIFQQLLKLYAPLVIPDISSNVLIVDADTIFLNSVTFFDHEDNALYAYSDEYCAAYFEHGNRVLPSFVKVFPKFSGICHHMMFQRLYLEELFEDIRKIHGDELWKVLCRCIDHKELFLSGISEYELYFNYVFGTGKKVKLRELKWRNMSFNRSDVQLCKMRGYHYVSCHDYTFEIA